MICDVEFLDLSTRPQVDVETAVERFKKVLERAIEKIAPPSFF